MRQPGYQTDTPLLTGYILLARSAEKNRCSLKYNADKIGLQLENVAIAMHCNLMPLDAAPVLIRFNSDAHAKFDVAQPVRCRMIRYVTL